MSSKFKTTMVIEVVVDTTVYPTDDGVPITQKEIEKFFTANAESLKAYAPEGADCTYTVSTVPVKDPLN